MKLNFDRHALGTQLILSFVVLVILTTATAGVPAIWLIQTQLERQAWAQLEQGRRAAQALYLARQSELLDLASLLAQRPTLPALLAQNDPAGLTGYLNTFQTGAGLDLVLVCNSDRQVVAPTGQALFDPLCLTGRPLGLHVASAGLRSEASAQGIQSRATTARIWLFATHPIGDEIAASPGEVVVGVALDEAFAVQMRDQTGLEHSLRMDGQTVATSLAGDGSQPWLALSTPPEGTIRADFNLDNRRYYGLRFPLSAPILTESGAGSNLEAEVALEVTSIITTQRHLALSLAGTMILVAAIGSALGTLLARRISRPLAGLAEMASGLSRDKADSPVVVESSVREVGLVAEALEQTRVELQRTLTDLRQEKAWTDHLLESIAEGIVALDDQGRITFFSPGAERIMGHRREEVLNRPCDQVFQPVELDRPFSRLLPAPGRRHNIMVELADGSQATLSVTGAGLRPPETDAARMALVFRDVSEQEAVHRLMGHFLANVSHEFRTPLSALAASVELLLDQAPQLSPAELRELLTSLHLGILALQKLVDNLLESASIEAGRFRVHPRPARLDKIVAEAIRLMQPLLDKHGQRLALELPVALPVVRADPRRTTQVLVNLLSNASKYGPDGDEITVVARVNEGWVRMSVADRGPGVPPEYRKDLFRRFVYPASTGDRSQYGAGLGLSVVKAIVEAHGGQVGVEDRPGGGLIFWFTLPVEEE